jgi:hypothetical protein
MSSKTRQDKNKKWVYNNKEQQEKVAVVTGSSSGIGQEISFFEIGKK